MDYWINGGERMTDEELKRLKELTNKMRGEFDISGKELEEYRELNIKRKLDFIRRESK